jgi:hypothetical protein
MNAFKPAFRPAIRPAITSLFGGVYGGGVYKNVVVIGASIVNGAFGQSLTVPHPESTALMNTDGVTGVNIYGYGWSGHYIDQLIPKIQEARAAFPNGDTLFVIHGGGNNVSASRPYSAMSQVVSDDFNAQLDLMYSTISSYINDVIVCDLTFRNYDGTTTYNQDQGSLPFIDNLYTPRRIAKYTNTDGRSVMDLHTFIRNNYNAALGPDRVHFTGNGTLLFHSFLVDRIKYLFNGGTMPIPVADTLGQVAPEPPVGGDDDAIIIAFSRTAKDNANGYTGVWVDNADFVQGNSKALHDVSGVATPYTMVYGAKPSLGSLSSGVVLGVDFNKTLISDPILKGALYTSSTDPINLEFTGFNAGQTVEISHAAAKENTDPRYTVMFETGNISNFAEYYVSGPTPPTPAVLTCTADASGVVKVYMTYTQSSSFVYLAGMRVKPL